MSDKNKKQSKSTDKEDPAVKPQTEEEVQAQEGTDEEPEQPNPFRFRRLDGQDPMKYEDVADK